MALSCIAKDPSSEFVVCTRTQTTLIIFKKSEWLWSPTHFFVICFCCFDLDAAQAKMLEQLTNKYYSTRSVNVKEKIVQGCGPCNINCSSFAITLSSFPAFKPFPSTNYALVVKNSTMGAVQGYHSLLESGWLIQPLPCFVIRVVESCNTSLTRILLPNSSSFTSYNETTLLVDVADVVVKVPESINIPFTSRNASESWMFPFLVRSANRNFI